MMTTTVRDAAPGRARVAIVLKRAFITIVVLVTLAAVWVHEAYVFRPADPQWAHLRPFRWWVLSMWRAALSPC